MPLKDSGVERKSAFSVRLFLKEFCVEFLQGAYNTLMKHVRVSIYLKQKYLSLDDLFNFFFIGNFSKI